MSTHPNASRGTPHIKLLTLTLHSSGDDLLSASAPALWCMLQTGSHSFSAMQNVISDNETMIVGCT
jgi:hypothetical protein